MQMHTHTHKRHQIDNDIQANVKQAKQASSDYALGLVQITVIQRYLFSKYFFPSCNHSLTHKTYENGVDNTINFDCIHTHTIFVDPNSIRTITQYVISCISYYAINAFYSPQILSHYAMIIEL